MSDTHPRIPELMEGLPERERAVTLRLTRAFDDQGEALYLVGGTVRDLLLGRSTTDLDFATSAEPSRTQLVGAAAEPSSVYTVGEDFGTVGFVFDRPDGSRSLVEITTYRSEVYPTPDRRPTVSHGVDLTSDLARRDFTINAIAVQPTTGELVDPFGGVADLRERRIVAVGVADERFNEDPLRVLRAARFAAQLGFDIAPKTLDAMRRAGPQLARISRERVANELNRLLVSPDPDRGLIALDDADLIRHVLPEIVPMVEDDRDAAGARHKDIWEHTMRVVRQSPARLAVRWAALLHDAAKPMTRSVDARGEVHFFGHELAGADLARRVARRLKQEKALEERTRRLVAMHLRAAGYDESWTDSAVRRLALEAGDAFDDLLDLAAADVTSARADKQAAAAARVGGLRSHFQRLEKQFALDQLQSPLDGDELMAMFDLPPGIWIKHVKERLRDMVIDGDLAPGDRETAERHARNWMAAPDDQLDQAIAGSVRRT
ncbi:MAG TPA: HD domain-containing protein [Thermomicrobiales bacterium]|nr:HD domain-containing protein [Thermomicrobiales bacterium]